MHAQHTPIYESLQQHPSLFTLQIRTRHLVLLISGKQQNVCRAGRGTMDSTTATPFMSLPVQAESDCAG